MQQWELHWGFVGRGEVEGHEQWAEPPRPFLVVGDGRIKRAGMVVVCPVTTKLKQEGLDQFRMTLTPDMISQDEPFHGSLEAGTLLCDHVWSLALRRFDPAAVAEASGNKTVWPTSRLGKLKPAYRAQVELCLKNVFNMK